MKKTFSLFSLLILTASSLGAISLQEYVKKYGNPQQDKKLRNHLDLSGKDLTDITGISNIKVITQDGTLKSLKETGGSLSLNLDNNKLRELPAEIGDLNNLSNLSLNSNNLINLPPEIGKLKLTRLSLNNNKLRNLPKEMGNMGNLSKLFLNNNLLTTLPVEMGKLSMITDLRLEDNQLTMLPDAIFNFEILRYLRLNNNKLTSISEKIVTLENLMLLLLNNNKLHALPAEIGNLKKLLVLEVGNNQLTQLPTSLAKLQELRYLNILANPSLLSWENLKASFNGSPDENFRAINFLKKLNLSGKLYYGDPLKHFAKSPAEILEQRESDKQLPDDMKKLIYSYVNLYR